MDYVSGIPLDKYLLKKGRLEHTLLVKFTAQIVLTLEKMHLLECNYFELRPSKMIVDSDGNLAIIPPFTVKGNLPSSDAEEACQYSAPEVLEATVLDWSKCDWWLLGILIYQFSIGNTPFRGQTPKDTVDKVLACKLVFPTDLSQVTVALIRKLLTIDPNERLCDTEAIKSDPFFDGINWESLENKVRKKQKREDVYVMPDIIESASQENNGFSLIGFSFAGDVTTSPVKSQDPFSQQ
mmetsp:Transcript_15080/g.16781  ORF Transcript_15080/g.16781 Transcript_15080/m.16781 type:complete len:238 (+) Transcript_15080:1748-2461(+)